jgi:iron complex transport system substrate-binding protein
LGVALTEELYLLGADDRLVGCTVYCQKKLPQAKEKDVVGTVIEINLEKVISLQPDLVLITSLTHPKTKQKLKNLGIKVVDFPEAKSFDEICEQFLVLAKIVGKEKKAKELLNHAKARVDSIKKRVEGLPKPKVFIQVGAKPLVTVTGDSFVNDFIEFAGGQNLARNLKSARYSKEMVIKNNPDVIIITTMGISGEEEKRMWQRYKSLKAVREDRIYIVDSDMLCSPTPVSFVETLEKIVEILHPQKDKNE